MTIADFLFISSRKGKRRETPYEVTRNKLEIVKAKG